MRKLAFTYQDEVLYTAVDNDVYEWASKDVWVGLSDAKGHMTVVTRKDGKLVRLHVAIMNPPKGMVVDHIDHDTLNNVRENLRVCSKKENNRNKKNRVVYKTSRYKGVSWNTRYNKWQGEVRADDLRVSWTTDDEEECAVIYDVNALHYHKEFAFLNFPDRIEEYKQMSNLVRKPRVKASKFRGVTKMRNNWQVVISVGGKAKTIGTYDDEHLAAMQADIAFVKLGRTTKLNFPERLGEYHEIINQELSECS